MFSEEDLKEGYYFFLNKHYKKMLLERMFGQKYALIRYHLFYEVERSELERVRHETRKFRH